MDTSEKYLPLGSVVLLKGGKKRMMVIGFLGQTEVEGKLTVFDYIGSLYPEGVISTEKTLLFNHDQIDKVFAVGYSDEEEKKFKENLKMIENKIVNNN